MSVEDDEVVEMEMQFHQQTERAILVSDDGEEDDAVWLPLSQIKFEWKDRRKGIIEVSMPAWLATERGLA